MQDGSVEWDIPEQGVLAYDVRRGLAHVLRENAWEFVIPDFSDEFFILSPIKNGMALIGRGDKILSPEGVVSCEMTGDGIKILLLKPARFSSGRLTVFSTVQNMAVPFQKAGGFGNGTYLTLQKYT